MEMLTLKITVKGRVQGVGYRWFTRENAQDLNLTGYVKNLPNENVEVLAQGEPEKVWELTKLLRNGPSFSSVIDIDIKELSDDQIYTSFEVSF